ncbi:ArsR family transcriptional regulator [Streptomyces sp. RLB1-33]|nr:ArsR family transcriptional regulator [Streptomyces sp. RLB1-33]
MATAGRGGSRSATRRHTSDPGGATTSDAFNAIAEPQRRDILALLRAGEWPVTDLAQELGMSQP